MWNKAHRVRHEVLANDPDKHNSIPVLYEHPYAHPQSVTVFKELWHGCGASITHCT